MTPMFSSLPLWLAFLIQFVIVIGAFVVVTAVLLASQKNATDRSAEELTLGSISGGIHFVTAPLQEVARATANLALHFVAGGLLLPNPTSLEASAALVQDTAAAYDDRWIGFRIALNTSLLSLYAYELACVNFTWSGVSLDCAMWSEIGCGYGQCYYQVGSAQRYGSFETISDPTVAMSSVNVTLQALEIGLLEDEYYVQALSNVSQLRGEWSVPYIWGNETDTSWGGGNLFLTRYYCVRFVSELVALRQTPWSYSGPASVPRKPAADDIQFSPCANGFAIDMNVTFMYSYLATLLPGDSIGLVALIDVGEEGGVVVASTAAASNNCGGSLCLARDSPVPQLKSAYDMYSACLVSGQPSKSSRPSSRSIHPTAPCRTLIDLTALDNSFILATQEVDADDGGQLQFLLVLAVDRQHYFYEWNRNLRVAVAVVACTSLLVVVMSAAMFFGISRPVATLIQNFQFASMLENEKVLAATSSIDEIEKLNAEFLVLNSRLLIARSFLPATILLNTGEVLASRRGNGTNDAEDGDDDIDEIADCAAPAAGIARNNAVNISVLLPSGQPFDRPTGIIPSAFSAAVSGDLQNAPAIVPAFSSSAENAPSMIGLQHHDELMQSKRMTDVVHQRNVAVLYGNIVQFESTMTAAPDIGRNIHGAILRVILRCTHSLKGSVDSFHGDRFLITFNASSICPAPVLRAVETMLTTLRRLRDIREANDISVSGSVNTPTRNSGASTSRQKGVLNEVRFGISCGSAVCGNLGNRSMMRFSVVGPCVNEAYALMLYCRMDGLSNAVSESVVGTLTAANNADNQSRDNQTAGLFRTLRVGYAHLPKRNSGSLFTSILGSPLENKMLLSAQNFPGYPPSLPPMTEATLSYVNEAFEAFAVGSFQKARESSAHITQPQHGVAIQRALAAVSSRSVLHN